MDERAFAKIKGGRQKDRLAILGDLHAGKSSPQTAADALASLTSKLSTKLGLNLPSRSLMGTIIVLARDEPDRQPKLVDVSVCLARRPDVNDAQGEPLMINDMHVWSDLPNLSSGFVYEWNGLPASSKDGLARVKTMEGFIHMNQFVARLMATNSPVFDFSEFALWTMRSALETPLEKASLPQPPEAFVPAAAKWISVLGRQIYHWVYEFEDEDLGRGGPLWEDGELGFSVERWKFWRKRFGEIAASEGTLNPEVREIAELAELMMGQVERKAAKDHSLHSAGQKRSWDESEGR